MKKLIFYFFVLFSTSLLAQVGINTTTPNAQLHIQSSNQAAPSNTDGMLIPKVDVFPTTNPTAAQQGMLVYLTTTSGSNLPGFYYWDNTSITWKPVGNEQDRDFLKVGTSEASTNFLDNKYTFGNNGFGTTTPARRLHVSNGVSGATSSGSTGILLESNANVYQHFLTLSTAENGLLFGTDTNPLGSSIIYNNVSNTDGFQFRTGGNFTRMTLTNTGNLGIGTISPARRLHVANGTSGATSNANAGLVIESNANVFQHFLTPSTAENGLLFGTDTNPLGSSIIYNNVSNTDGFQFRTGGNFTRMTLTNTGNLGIGTVSPARRLHVANGTSGATSNANAGLVIESNANVFQHFLTPSTAENGLLFGTDTNSIGSGLIFNNTSTLNGLQFRTGGNTTRMTLTNTGNLGIGSITPQERLHVIGNIRMVDGNEAAGKVLTSDANGTASWQNSTISAWGLNGNTTTNPAINFIGTTDNQDLIFRRNNLQSGLIGLTNTSFGSSTLASNTTGTNNTAIGRVSLNSNTTGAFNTAIGGFALSTNSTGVNNTAVGYQANLNNTIGQSNTSLGQLALLNTTSGGFNTAVGRQSLTNNITGSSNSVLGALSNVGADNLINATAIGARAQVDNSNSVVLGSVVGINGAVASVNVGIGTTSPARRLHVSNGTSGGTSTFGTGILIESNTSVYQQFLSPNLSESGLLFGSNVASILGGVIFQNNTQSLNFRVGGGVTRMVISNLGDVGIGTFPGGQFELSLNEGRKPLSNFWTVTSDARLKNVNGIYEKGLSEIIQLKPIRYNYKNSDKRQFEQKVLDQEATGFLAQEVQQIFPEAVGVDRDGYLNFDLHPIMIASINAFKELNKKYEDLKSKNEVLENKLNELLIRIEKIENK